MAANAATHRHDFLVALERSEKIKKAADAAEAAAAAAPQPVAPAPQPVSPLDAGLRIVPAG